VRGGSDITSFSKYNKVGNTHRVKVCDFGLSAIKLRTGVRDECGAKGTPLYMVGLAPLVVSKISVFINFWSFLCDQAPEVMLQEEFDEKADVYSFGIVLWEILTGKVGPLPLVSYRPISHFKLILFCRTHSHTTQTTQNLWKVSWQRKRGRPFQATVPRDSNF